MAAAVVLGRSRYVVIVSVQASPALPAVVPAAVLAVLASVSVLCHRPCQIANMGLVGTNSQLSKTPT